MIIYLYIWNYKIILEEADYERSIGVEPVSRSCSVALRQ